MNIKEESSMLGLLITIAFTVILILAIAVVGVFLYATIGIVPIVVEMILTALAVRWIVYILRKD